MNQGFRGEKIMDFKPPSLKLQGNASLIAGIVLLQDRKITLIPGDAGHTDNWQQYAGGSQNSLGSLGEKLQAALKEKKKT